MKNTHDSLGLTIATALLGAGMAFSSSIAILGLGSGAAIAQEVEPRAATAKLPPVNDGLPMPGFKITPVNTAIVITDPQNGTVENLDALFAVAETVDMPVFVSPHYYYEHDHEWQFEGALEALMHSIGMFDRPHALSLDGFEGSGADWLESYKPYFERADVVVTSPHKVYGPDSNDLALQLRKAGIDKVILGGMSSNLCTESHMRSLIEAGFEVMVVTDATAGAITEHYDGYAASLTNFRMIASAVDNTENTVRAIEGAYGM